MSAPISPALSESLLPPALFSLRRLEKRVIKTPFLHEASGVYPFWGYFPLKEDNWKTFYWVSILIFPYKGFQTFLPEVLLAHVFFRSLPMPSPSYHFNLFPLPGSEIGKQLDQ
jgi:hypothetical protein